MIGSYSFQPLGKKMHYQLIPGYNVVCFVVFASLRLNNAWASGTVLRPILQPESPLSSRSLVSGFKCKLRDSNSRPPHSRRRALTTRLYTIHWGWCTGYNVNSLTREVSDAEPGGTDENIEIFQPHSLPLFNLSPLFHVRFGNSDRGFGTGPDQALNGQMKIPILNIKLCEKLKLTWNK